MIALAACFIATTLGANEQAPPRPQTVTPATILLEEYVDTGVLILNGDYLPAPYAITATDTGFTVNQITIPWEAFAQQDSLPVSDITKRDQTQVKRGRQPRRHPRWWNTNFSRLSERRGNTLDSANEEDTDRVTAAPQRPEPQSTTAGEMPRSPRIDSIGIDIGIDYPFAPQEFAELVVRTLQSGDPVIHLPNEPVLVAQESMKIDSVFASLAPSTVEGDLKVLDWTDCLPMRSDDTTWTAWLASFATPPNLQTYIEERFRAIELFVSETRSTRAALTTIDTAAYPLSVFGMLIAVMSLGHLLRSVPDSSESSQSTSSERLRRATTIAVCLIAGLSMLDLTWTILAAQAGTIRELNPLGAQLIHDPAALSAFKIVATSVGCALLYHLRSHRRAADATWWMCLVMTVVTFRWVMFNSMFA